MIFVSKKHKKELQINEIDSIEIQQYNTDEVEKSTLKISNEQIEAFVKKWNKAPKKGLYKYIPNYFITVCLKDNTKRGFRTNGKLIKEDTDICFSIRSKTFFDNLWKELQNN